VSTELETQISSEVEPKVMSEEKPMVVPEEKPKGPLSLIVRNVNGTFSERLKDPKTGHFMKKQRPMPSAKELVRVGRQLLTSAEVGPDGKMIRGATTRHRKIFDNLVRIATLETDDPKALMSIIKAAELLYLRFYGKPSASDEEIEALKVHGVKIVVVQSPTLMHPDVVEQKPEDKSAPSFINAEFVTAQE
jgi:hypothetical protein